MEIASAPRAFTALRADGMAIAWGDPSSGGDAELCEVTAIQVTSRAFAAIKRDGSVVTWGHFGWNSVCLVMFVDFLNPMNTTWWFIPRLVSGLVHPSEFSGLTLQKSHL